MQRFSNSRGLRPKKKEEGPNCKLDKLRGHRRKKTLKRTWKEGKVLEDIHCDELVNVWRYCSLWRHYHYSNMVPTGLPLFVSFSYWIGQECWDAIEFNVFFFFFYYFSALGKRYEFRWFSKIKDKNICMCVFVVYLYMQEMETVIGATC